MSTREHVGQNWSTLVATAITNETNFQQQLINANNIDRLNLGPIPTIKLDWLQPHEGNIIDFLYRSRALQLAETSELVSTATAAPAQSGT